MSQEFDVIDPSVPGGDTGTTTAQKLNDWRDAVLTKHSGSTRPSYAVAGTEWRDTTGTPWIVNLYDGSADIPLYEIDPATHIVTKVYAAPASAVQILAGVAVGVWIDPAGLQSRMAAVSDYRSRTTGKILTSNIIATALAEVNLVDAATIALDLNTFVNGAVTMASTGRVIGLPTNGVNGWSGRVRVTQGTGGSKVPTFDTGWQFSGGVPPVFSTAAGAVDHLYYECLPSGDVLGALVNDVKRP